MRHDYNFMRHDYTVKQHDYNDKRNDYKYYKYDRSKANQVSPKLREIEAKQTIALNLTGLNQKSWQDNPDIIIIPRNIIILLLNTIFMPLHIIIMPFNSIIMPLHIIIMPLNSKIMPHNIIIMLLNILYSCRFTL